MNFKLIRITYTNFLHRSDFLCFLFMTYWWIWEVIHQTWGRVTDIQTFEKWVKKKQSAASLKFMIIRIAYLNLLHGDEFFCFLSINHEWIWQYFTKAVVVRNSMSCRESCFIAWAGLKLITVWWCYPAYTLYQVIWWRNSEDWDEKF